MLLTYTGKDILVLATRLAIYVSFESTSAKTELVKSPYGLISRLTVMALTVVSLSYVDQQSWVGVQLLGLSLVEVGTQT